MLGYALLRHKCIRRVFQGLAYQDMLGSAMLFKCIFSKLYRVWICFSRECCLGYDIKGVLFYDMIS